MFKKTFLLMLAALAILPFAGQLSAATQDVKAEDQVAIIWGWGGRGYGFGGGYGYGGYGYGYGYPYSYGGCCGSYGYGYPYSYGGCCY